MSEDHLVGHCGTILPKFKFCYPSLIDDLCPGCPLNGYELAPEEEDPEAPWKDPISGEVDYEAMEEDLGLDTGMREEEYCE